jgi:hypothetical protein
VSKGHSPTGGYTGRDKSDNIYAASKRGALTLWRTQIKGQVKPEK